MIDGIARRIRGYRDTSMTPKELLDESFKHAPLLAKGSPHVQAHIHEAHVEAGLAAVEWMRSTPGFYTSWGTISWRGWQTMIDYSTEHAVSINLLVTAMKIRS